MSKSTNDHYIAKGIFVKADGNAFLVIELAKNDTYKEAISIQVNGVTINIPSMDALVGNKPNNEITIKLPNKDEVFTSGNDFLVISLGAFRDITESFTFFVDTGSPGWNIGGTVTVNIKYEISKTVNKPSTTIGDKITYTVTIKNTGDIALYGIDVIDNVPKVLIITKVNQGKLTTPIETGTVTLAENVTLAKNESKTYTITAIVSDKTEIEDITNIATMAAILLFQNQHKLL